MKKFFSLISAIIIGLQSFSFPARIVNERVLQTFKENFPDAEQVIWKEYPETYVVNFVEDGIRSSIIYEKDGGFISSTRYYQEKNLPYYLLVNVRKKYPGKKVYGVTEISTISGIEYFLKMEDANIWITVKVDSEGNLTLVEKYKKAS